MSDLMEDIKNLREITGAGFLDCKKALEECSHDIDLSIDFLRKKGLAKANKKSSREAKEGAIGVYSNNKISTIIQINTETDFAAKNEVFLNFMDEIGNYSLEIKDMSYSVEPYTPSDTPFDTIVVHGTGGVLVNGEQLEGWNPALAKLLTPDNDNPYQFHGVIELFDPSGDNSGAGGSFILGATIGGWQPFWRFDDGSEPEITVPNGGETYTFGSESYGTYDVTFDTHLNRFKATSNN